MYSYPAPGIAPILGRRFGSLKLPYSKNRSVAGIIAMVAASFLPPFSHYQNLMYSSLTKKVAQQVDALFLDIWVPSRKLENGTQILCGVSCCWISGFSTKLDDNLTVPLASIG